MKKINKANAEEFITIEYKNGELADFTFPSIKKAINFILDSNYSGAKVINFPSRTVLAI